MVSPYRVPTNYRRPTAGDSDHGYSTMTPHDDSELAPYFEPLPMDRHPEHSLSSPSSRTSSPLSCLPPSTTSTLLKVEGGVPAWVSHSKEKVESGVPGWVSHNKEKVESGVPAWVVQHKGLGCVREGKVYVEAQVHTESCLPVKVHTESGVPSWVLHSKDKAKGCVVHGGK